MQLLGEDWSHLINDITEGGAGNQERSAYLFNKTRVDSAGLAGEIALWDDLTQDSDIKQFKRTPCMTGFRAGWKSFAMINVHLHPGEAPEDVDCRGKEGALLLKALRAKRERNHLWTENLIIAGDFNFYTGKDDAAFRAIIDNDYEEVESGGVFNPFDYVHKAGIEATYLPDMKAVYGGDSNLIR